MPYTPANHPSLTTPEDAPTAFPPIDPASLPSTDADSIPTSEILPPPIANPRLPDVTLPRIVLGCAPFGFGVYTTDSGVVRSTLPARIVRAALRAGMTAFDTGESA